MGGLLQKNNLYCVNSNCDLIFFYQGATVATIQHGEIQDGVLYPNREGTLETVTIRESNTGTLYVWPVFMN